MQARSSRRPSAERCADRRGGGRNRSGPDRVQQRERGLCAPTPQTTRPRRCSPPRRDQAYAGYLSAKAAEGQLKSTDLDAARAQAKAGVDQAYAACKGAQAQLSKLQGGSTKSQRAAAKAGVTQASDALKLRRGEPRRCDARARRSTAWSSSTTPRPQQRRRRGGGGQHFREARRGLCRLAGIRALQRRRPRRPEVHGRGRRGRHRPGQGRHEHGRHARLVSRARPSRPR